MLLHSDQITRELHRLVTDIKKDGAVGLAYMKSVEIEKRIREEGRSLIVRVFKCTKENGYTTVRRLIEAGDDEETAATAIEMLNI